MSSVSSSGGGSGGGDDSSRGRSVLVRTRRKSLFLGVFYGRSGLQMRKEEHGQGIWRRRGPEEEEEK